MNIIRPKYPIFLLFFLCFAFYTPAFSQSIPQNLSNVQVSDLSDTQINQLIQQASSSGLSDAQLIQLAEQRGLPVSESQALQNRINDVRRKGMTATSNTQADTVQSGSRTLNYQPESNLNSSTKAAKPALPKIFGADIFRNSNLSFAPNLNLATPTNYVVGPQDQLDVNIYGNSLVNWKLNVSPEGNINMPGVGLLNVAGKTIEQATESIKSKLSSSNYAIGHGTSVQVSLGNIRSIKVIMIGELVKPGSYTLPSLATAFNALYAAGGPNNNGSFRQIEIIRNNKIIRHLDVYDFLVKGDQKDNIGLQDQDIIRVPTYRTRVEMSGEIKTPALFEVLPGETLKDVINFAGGFTDTAYTSRITILQVSDQQRRVTDVTEDNFGNYIPLRGDKYIVQRILARYENRVIINGAVFRPGIFELDKGLTVSALITKAAGLKEDAFTNRASITRLNPDNTKQIISFDVRAVIAKTAPDIVLQREDSVYISSIFELRDKFSVAIKGEVRKPGEYAFADSVNVADLIIKAGGFAEGASGKRIQVGRRITDSDPNSASSKVAIVYSIDVDQGLQLNNADFVLHPYDIVSVYSLPGYEKQRTVKVEGEILYPGYYTLENKNEKISDIIKRAGNLTASADPDGGSLKRTNIAILGIDKNKTDTTALLQENAERAQRVSRVYKDSTDTDTQRRNNYIGINLTEIIKKPGSVTDLLLEDGDVLRVPKQQQVVKVNGQVLYPSVVVYENGKGFKGFILNAGGFSPQALTRGSYIVYANGTVKGTRKFLFFNSYPAVKPGSEIYVPKKPEKRPLTAGEVIGITSGLASIAAVILGIISLHK